MSVSTGPIGVGFIGSGPVTQAIHLPAMATLGEAFRVVRVVDIDPDLANAVAERYGVSASTDAADVLSDPAIDVVAICSPNVLHAEHTIAACRAGKRAVLCEKPLAVSPAEAAAIRDAARASGTSIFVGTMHAYDPAYRAALAAWQALDDQPVLLRNAIFLPGNEVYTDQATEMVAASVAAGDAPALTVIETLRLAVLGLAIHDLPLVRDFQPSMGKLLDARFLPPFGYVLVMQSGTLLTELTAYVPGQWPPKWDLEVFGATYRMRVELPPSFVMAGSARVELSGPDGTRVFQSSQNGYQALWEAIATTVRGGAPPFDIESAIADLESGLDLAASIETMLEAAI